MCVYVVRFLKHLFLISDARKQNRFTSMTRDVQNQYVAMKVYCVLNTYQRARLVKPITPEKGQAFVWHYAYATRHLEYQRRAIAIPKK